MKLICIFREFRFKKRQIRHIENQEDFKRCDRRNILALIFQIKDANPYILDTKQWILIQLCLINIFKICNEKFNSTEEPRISANTENKDYYRCGHQLGCLSDKCKCFLKRDQNNFFDRRSVLELGPNVEIEGP
ncbi:hypothetical protein CWI38_0799p0010 [Hamiltosporidium tvaerminnensis]|uniref:Uncharacterized protein n=1 Tax=Hamiltosporidium tvaerminnensis TaxID=1176355 RepID=A0A4V2JXL8_9MICR|nr:hypothetical protein CWI38_0799p0010 [Hamiltosporidium tvaerminnensis]